MAVVQRVRFVYVIFDAEIDRAKDPPCRLVFHPWRLVALLSTVGLGLALIVLG